MPTYWFHMSEKLAARLRRHHLQAKQFFIGVRNFAWGWIGGRARLAYPSDDGQMLYHLCCEVIEQYWHHEPVYQVQLTALDPKPRLQQLDLLLPFDAKRFITNRIVDDINQRYGEFTIAPARLLHRSTMPNVISPAWKPEGHRQTIGLL